jgi:hypothetical protein
MPRSADDIARVIANAEEKFQLVEDQTYELALALFLDGFTRPEVEAVLQVHAARLAAQVEASDEVRLAWRQAMRGVIARVVERAERESKKRKIQ